MQSVMGKAKLLFFYANSEGMGTRCISVTDFKDNFLGHAYNYVKVNEKWYLIASTFGSNRLKLNDELSVVLPSYNMFLTNPIVHMKMTLVTILKCMKI